MPDDDGYRLLTVDAGWRVERFGPRIVARPAPGTAAMSPPGPPRVPADLSFRRNVGWSGAAEPWTVGWENLRLELRPTATGQVGVFPEQAAMWPWLADRVAGGGDASAPSVLNLFAYTGGASLHLARLGARVVHVDASRPTVAWARRNAELSDLGTAPIRWLVEDAGTLVARDVRRGRTYDGIVLDPPTWGHGAGGRPWRLEDDLDPLLAGCSRLLTARGAFVLLTAHTPGWDGARLESALDRWFRAARSESGALELTADDGTTLALGAWARAIMSP